MNRQFQRRERVRSKLWIAEAPVLLGGEGPMHGIDTARLPH